MSYALLNLEDIEQETNLEFLYEFWYDYYPAEPSDFYYLGSPASVGVYKIVRDDGKQIDFDMLNVLVREEIEEKLIEGERDHGKE